VRLAAVSVTSARWMDGQIDKQTITGKITEFDLHRNKAAV